MIFKITSSIPKTISLLLFVLAVNIGFTQKTWSFQDCVDYALVNNINVNQSKLNAEFAKNTVLQNKMGMFTPNINASITEGFNFANSVDPLTYEFIQQSTNSTSGGIYLDWSLFEGLSRMNQLKAAEHEFNATYYEQLELENNTKLLVANYYLNALMAKEALQIAKEKLNLTNNQLDNTIELINAGVLAEGDKYEINAQLANDELSVVSAENNLEMALNQLKLLLQLDPFEAFELQGIEISDNELEVVVTNPTELGNKAINNLPNMKSAELRLQAANYGLKSAKGSLSPTFSVSGYLGTNYFSASQEQIGTNPATLLPIGAVGNTGDLVFTSYEQPIFDKKTFGSQIGDNFNQNIRLNLSIPIFGKWQRMIAIDNAKLNIIKTEFDLDNKKNTLQQDVFNAYTNLKLSKKQLAANQKNNEAASLAFSYAEEKFKAGIINTYEFETAKNRFITAQGNNVQSKFDFIFKKMIVNFYETGNLSF